MMETRTKMTTSTREEIKVGQMTIRFLVEGEQSAGSVAVFEFDVPAGAKTLTLPHNPNIRILAATVSNQSAQAWPAQPLYDVIQPSKEAATQ